MHFRIQYVTIFFDIRRFSLNIQGLEIPVHLIVLESNSLL